MESLLTRQMLLVRGLFIFVVEWQPMRGSIGHCSSVNASSQIAGRGTGWMLEQFLTVREKKKEKERKKKKKKKQRDNSVN